MIEHKVGPIRVVIMPRETFESWTDFMVKTPPLSIALDGVVPGGPKFAVTSHHVNFDHHDSVVREATMSTAMQVYLAIKGGLMNRRNADHMLRRVYINDTDQDTSLAVWLLTKYKLFEGTASIAPINRLLALTNWLDITGGAFPMNLDDQLLAHHNWVFAPYTELRTSGALASATGEVLRDNLEAVLSRLDKFMMGEAGEVFLDTRHEMLHQHPDFWMVDEIGGNHARYYLYGQGMKAFISIVARRPDGRFVYSIGRRSRYVDFPLPQIYHALNEVEGSGGKWGGSDIIGGSPRLEGSTLMWQQILPLVARLCACEDGGL